MEVLIEDKLVKVIVTRKKNKNTYIRVKEDLNIYVTTNYLMREKDILKLIDDNINQITKMFNRMERKVKQEESFYYLGKKYDIVYLNQKDIIFGDEKIFISHDFDINKWLLKEAKQIFLVELDKIYHLFPYSIPYPSLTIRKMKTRFGVCNVKTKRVTLNLELIYKDIKYLDYVIVHELSHLIYPNHSKDFWQLVSMMVPNYKEIRKEMRNYE